MKKILVLIISVFVLSLLLAGCSEIMKVSAPTMEIERNGIGIECNYNYATAVIGSQQGTERDGTPIALIRTDPDNATGQVDGYFYSLGFSLDNPENPGMIILDFGHLVGGCINVLETSPINGTYGQNGGIYYLEKAKVYVTDDLSNGWDYLGLAQNQRDDAVPVIFDPDGANIPTGAHPNVFQLEKCVRYVKIVDVTDPETTPVNVHDAVDVDEVYAGLCIEVPLDIKPTSCPNPLNVKSKGVLPVAILGTEEFDVNDIDPASVRLEGVAPLRWALEDVATPYEPYVEKEDCMDCNQCGPDGYTDLTLKFNKQEIITVLGDVEDGDCLVLTLQGELLDGTPIYGEDVVKILKKGK